MKLDYIDLNLLRLMLILLEDGSVSRAATRLNLSQSAVSKQLTRLREQLGEVLEDPLFIRTGRGLTPTARAAKLEKPLRQWLRDSHIMLLPESFDPATDERSFTISICETAFPVIVPRLMPKLNSLAPNMQLSIVPKTKQSLSHLNQGELDLLITAKDTDRRAQASFHISDIGDQPNLELYRDRHICLVSQSHAINADNWDAKAFLDTDLVRIFVDDSEFWLLDRVVSEQGYRLNDKAKVPDFHSAALLAQHSNMMLVCTSIFANQLANKYSLKVLPLPFDLKPVSYRMLWPTMLERDSAHQWLRELIAECCSDLA
ncbi:lysR-family transcriptional regulator [Vibrio ishigakensis]|uniref:LysR-family transcriptional regulator n=2 Tax=Vibrio ishigakensis TaxID=1481914 RepID=A0A0B8PB06_9VIBR|nr:lysR-family transcriptional regulator [Vibrio ishigakensis]